ncbi:hypothetical protein [Mycolicibacterium frederiksbergense]|uniref:hypothetical protein n=1 Tax=Mycolicibacterium frederiksbergense TaxID=117567 RepID=UPI00265C0A3A|nr:hypothetical protein [Mycolicibacterium frederiksbergense]MDO0974025.1 hypothetical protein [Mycolicibacterium frederiksbergense]
MPEVISSATRIARAVKARDPEAEAQARRELAEAKIADYIRRVVDAAPPLTDEQRTRLAELLRPVRREGGAA